MRVERWLTYLQQFDFILEYQAGGKNIADYLSRHAIPASSQEEKASQYREEVVKMLIQHTVPRALTLQEIQEATENDEEMQRLKECITNSHHTRVKSTPSLNKYARVFPELSIAHQVTVRGDRILIPEKLQSRVLDICHESHSGIVRSKQLLRSKVWFPGIDKQMEKKIANCIPCQAVDTKYRRDLLQMSELPEHPWQNIAVDFWRDAPSRHRQKVSISVL